MGNINGKFVDQDSYILGQLLQSSTSNVGDLHVAVQDTDYLRSTTVQLKPLGLTTAPGTPYPNVSSIAQQTVGNGVADGSITTGGTPVPPPPRCPEINQYVLIRGITGKPIPIKVEFVTIENYLYNPITDAFEQLISAEMFASDLWEVIAKNGARSIGSPSHPLIGGIWDTKGLALNRCAKSSPALSIVNNDLTDSFVLKLFPKRKKGMVRKLETFGPDHRYCAGNRPDRMLVWHNNKPPAPDL